MVRVTSDSLDAAARHAMSYTAIARAVNPDFDAQRPWPAFHLCDGGFIDTAFFDPHMSLAGLQVEYVYIPGEPPEDYSPPLVVSQVTGAVARAWAARFGPGILIHPGRAGGKLRYNTQIHTTEHMRAYVDQYLWVVEALTRRPDVEVDALRREYERRFAS
jgi:hypothetical protein